jgi:hypothetical protein
MTEFVYMRAPWGGAEVRRVEATLEVLTPLMISGSTQCDPPANAEEVTTDVHN